MSVPIFVVTTRAVNSQPVVGGLEYAIFTKKVSQNKELHRPKY
jgi:hypothetical protein